MPEVTIRKTEIADFIRNGVSVIRRRGLAWDDSRLWQLRVAATSSRRGDAPPLSLSSYVVVLQQARTGH